MSRPDDIPSDWIRCQHCRGAGFVAGIPCSRCSEKGFVPKVTIPCPCYSCRSEQPTPVSEMDLWGKA